MLFYFLQAFLVLKHRLIDENSHRSIATILVTLTHCLANISIGLRASSRRRQVDYSQVNYRELFTAFSRAGM